MHVSLSVGMWMANGNPNPYADHTPACSRKVLVQVWPPPSHPSGPRGPETHIAEEHIFENCLQNERCSAGCKSNRPAPGTSANWKYYRVFTFINCCIWMGVNVRRLTFHSNKNFFLMINGMIFEIAFNGVVNLFQQVFPKSNFPKHVFYGGGSPILFIDFWLTSLKLLTNCLKIIK